MRRFILIVMVLFTCGAQAATPKVTFLCDGIARCVNENGAVAGDSSLFDTSGKSIDRAFVWMPNVPNGTVGVLTQLESLPGDTFSSAAAISDTGLVVGSDTDRVTYTYKAVYWTNSFGSWTVHLLGNTTGSFGSEALGVNDTGDIVGYQIDGNSHYHATLWRGGTSTIIGGILGDTNSIAVAINGRGTVIGYSWSGFDQTSGHGFIVQNGVMHLIAPPSSQYLNLLPSGVNDLDVIIGNAYYSNGSGMSMAAINRNGLSSTRARSTIDSRANAINDRNVIVGEWIGHSGERRSGFITEKYVFAIDAVIRGIGPELHGINNAGQIVGVFGTEMLPAAFLLTP